MASPVADRIVTEMVAAFLLGQGVAAVDANIHAPGQEGDERNWHVHMMIPARSQDGPGNAPRDHDVSRAFRRQISRIMSDARASQL